MTIDYGIDSNRASHRHATTPTPVAIGISAALLYAVVVVTFQQNYRSNNYREQSAKRQYWQKELDGVWRIIYEGPA